MRRLLEADTAPAGGYNERIHCSSDPASLDGAALRGAGALFLDATAPHTLDCKYPGAAERVVCLYDTLDNAGLAARRGEVLALGARNTALLRQAAAHWALACGLLASRRALAALALDTARLDAFARRLANRTMPPAPCRLPRQTGPPAAFGPNAGWTDRIHRHGRRPGTPNALYPAGCRRRRGRTPAWRAGRPRAEKRL